MTGATVGVGRVKRGQKKFGDQRRNDRPLFVIQFFSSRHNISLARLFMKWLLADYMQKQPYLFVQHKSMITAQLSLRDRFSAQLTFKSA
jgi:hypothetical protein